VTLIQILQVSLFMGSTAANYGIILFCVYKYHMVLRGGTELSRHRLINHQLSVVINLQAVTPLLLVLLPTTGTIVAVLLGASGTWLIQSAYCFVTLLPVLNPLYALLLVKSYRNALCSWFKSVKCRRHVDSST
ncbi:7TM GPCR protein, partial [Aphelenchoides avenae]